MSVIEYPHAQAETMRTVPVAPKVEIMGLNKHIKLNNGVWMAGCAEARTIKLTFKVRRRREYIDSFLSKVVRREKFSLSRYDVIILFINETV